MNKDEYLVDRIQKLENENAQLHDKLNKEQRFVFLAKQLQKMIKIEKSDNFEEVYCVYIAGNFLTSFVANDPEIEIDMIKEFKECKCE